MVSFDFTSLTPLHLISFGLTFVITYFLVAVLLAPSRRSEARPAGRGSLAVTRSGRAAKPFLRRHLASSAFYVGPIIVTILSIATLVLLGPSPLTFGLVIAGLITILVGMYDEEHRLTPFAQFIWQIVIAALVVGWGWHIPYVTNPLAEGLIDLSVLTVGTIVIPGSIFTIVWILVLINSINWIDGMDGLAGLISLIAFITLAAISLLPSNQDTNTLLLAGIGSGTCLGFLLWNLPPAKVYLGTSGSWFLGLFIALAAINGGGKIATTLLVLSLPVIDFLAVILQRISSGQAPWQGDTKFHLHYRLRQLRIPDYLILLLLAGISIVLGFLAVVLQTEYKLATFFVAGLILFIITIIVFYRQRPSGQKLKHP